VLILNCLETGGNDELSFFNSQVMLLFPVAEYYGAHKYYCSGKDCNLTPAIRNKKFSSKSQALALIAPFIALSTMVALCNKMWSCAAE